MPQHARRDPARPPRYRPRPRLRLALLVLIVLLALSYGSIAIGLRVSHDLLPGNELQAPGALSGLPGLSPGLSAPSRRINFLIMGIDHRPGKSNEYLPHVAGAPEDPGRSDTMAVFSVDPGTKSASLLSIPRDLWLNVPDGHGGWTLDRINEAYHTGEVDKLPGGGPQAAMAAIRQNFGISIDHYVALDFNQFIGLVDAIGGIDVDVPRTLTATVLPKADDGGYEYTFFAGRQHLNGELALAYARFRLDPDGDFGRIRRQQTVALAARERVLSLGWLSRSVAVWDKYSSAVVTDIPVYQVPGLALLVKQVQVNGITARSLGEPGATTETILPGSGADVLVPDPMSISRIVAETFGDPVIGAQALAQLRQLYPATGPAATGATTPASIPAPR